MRRRSSQHAAESHKRRSIQQGGRRGQPFIIPGDHSNKADNSGAGGSSSVQLRRLLFFLPLIPRILQAAVRDLDVTNRGVIGGQLVSENLLDPQWDLEVQVPIMEGEGDQFLGLLSRDAAKRREGSE